MTSKMCSKMPPRMSRAAKMSAIGCSSMFSIDSSHTSRTMTRWVACIWGLIIQLTHNFFQVLEKRFPSAMHIYRVFSVGVKDFYGDMKRYVKIYNIVNSSTKGFAALTRQEMELYQQMPKDIMRIGPVLLVATLPFANYVVFPLAWVWSLTFEFYCDFHNSN